LVRVTEAGAMAAGRWVGRGDKEGGDGAAVDAMRELVNSGVLARFPTLDAYRRRCEARPAFGRAMEAQMKPFSEYAPAAS